MQNENVIKDFSNISNCELTILKDGEHYFHAEEQLNYCKNWLEKIIV